MTSAASMVLCTQSGRALAPLSRRHHGAPKLSASHPEAKLCTLLQAAPPRAKWRNVVDLTMNRGPPTPMRSPSPMKCVAGQREGAPNAAAGTAAAAAAGASEESGTEDQMLKGLSLSAEVSVTTVVGTRLVQEAQRRHGLAPTAAAALGRLLMGALLLGAKQGPDEVVQVSVSGRGPIGQMTAVATNGALVKGFVGDPLCDPPLNAKGKMDVGAAVGQGVIAVVRTHPAWQQPYTGTVPIQTGEIAEDLAHYLAESEQVNSALGLGVAVGKDGGVIAAGGFLVQVLPFCSEETLQVLEHNVSHMPPVSDLVRAGADCSALTARLLEDLEWEPAGDPVVPTYGPCGVEELRPRMLRAVQALGEDDVAALLEEQGRVKVKCEFCSETLSFSETDVREYLAASK